MLSHYLCLHDVDANPDAVDADQPLITLHGGALPEPIVGSSTLIAQYISDGSVTGSGCVEMLWSICIRYITWSVLMWCGVRVCRFEADFVCCSERSPNFCAECPVGFYGPPGGTHLYNTSFHPACSSVMVELRINLLQFAAQVSWLTEGLVSTADDTPACTDPASAPPPPPELNACSDSGIELVDAGHMRLTSMQNNQHCTWTMTCSEPTHAPQ
eukprot:COSAG02_NODE_367_length_23739_cov_16.775127_13_plen_214_part_00